MAKSPWDRKTIWDRMRERDQKVKREKFPRPALCTIPGPRLVKVPPPKKDTP